MPNIPTPQGITPPAPGLDREEPTFVPEKDIPDGEGRRPAGRNERGAVREDRAPAGPDRE